MNDQLNTLVQNIIETSYDDFSDEVLIATKKGFIDTIGVAVLGSSEECVSILLSVYGDRIGTSTVIGKSDCLSLEQAIVINGTAAHALDYDDTGASTQSHPSAILIPAVLALAEKHQLIGKKIIEAYVVGIEIFTIVSKSLPLLHLKGWHPSGVLGTIASAAACAKLMDLNFIEIKKALSIAASFSSGLIANFGSMTKPLHIGRSSYNGLLAVQLAKEGFTASRNVWKKDGNFLSVLSGEKVSKFNDLQNFGRPFSLINPGLNIKQYPSCSLSHRAIDIAIKLSIENNIQTEFIDKIKCRVTPRAKKVLSYNNISDPLEGKFSMQYLLACSIFFKDVGPHHFTRKIGTSTEIQTLMQKVDFEVHEDWVDGKNDWRPDTVEIIMSSGKVYRSECIYPKGHAKNPLSLSELKKKFNYCTQPVLGSEASEIVYNELMKLEKLKNLKTLFQFLSKSSEIC